MPFRNKTTPTDLSSDSATTLLAGNGKLSQLLLDSAPDAMVIVNQQGTIILVNRQTESLFGYSRDELLDQPVEIILPERFRRRHVEHRASFAADPRIRAMGTGLDLYARYRDGSEFPVEIMLSPIRVGGQLLVSAAIRDVTERKREHVEFQAERLKTKRQLDMRSQDLRSNFEERVWAESMATVGIVAAQILFDLNNAMAPIRTHLASLRQHESIDALKDVEGIERSMNYISDVCKRMRLLIAQEKGNAITDLSEWWREVTPLLTGVLPPDVKLEPMIPDKLPPVKVSRVELTQAVVNLAHNASRAMRGSKAAVLKIWAEPSPGHRMVRLGVSDNGPGIPPEIKERVLNSDPGKDIFSSGGQDGGIGHGLMLVKSIVTRVKGEINIDSEPGKGTTVTLLVPVTHN